MSDSSRASSSSSATSRSRVVYTVPMALAVRGVGVGALCVGIAVVGATAVLAFDVTGAGLTVLLVLLGIVALAGLVVLGVGVLRLAGRGTRLVLDDDGFLNATGPRGGMRRVRWKDVKKVQADGPVVSVDVGGDRRSLIRTQSLDVAPRDLARELRSRLNASHGYRPLDRG